MPDAAFDCAPGYSCANNRCVTGSGTLVGAEGGKITDSTGTLELVVPQGALRSQVAIGIHALEAWPEGALGQVFQIEPSGINFAVPATLTYTYAPAEIGNAPPLGLKLGYATGSTWSAIPSTVDPAQHKVSGSIAHLSTYGLLGPDAGGNPVMMGPVDGGVAQCTPLNLMGPWKAVADANTSPEVVTVTNQAPGSVTVSFNNPLGAQACGCNAQSLVIPLGRPYPCASTRLNFTYSTAFVSNAIMSPSLQVRFSTGAPPNPEPMSYSGDMFDGSVWNGHSNCAYTFGWNNTFPTTPAIKNGAITPINFEPLQHQPRQWLGAMSRDVRYGRCAHAILRVRWVRNRDADEPHALRTSDAAPVRFHAARSGRAMHLGLVRGRSMPKFFRLATGSLIAWTSARRCSRALQCGRTAEEQSRRSRAPRLRVGALSRWSRRRRVGRPRARD